MDWAIRSSAVGLRLSSGILFPFTLYCLLLWLESSYSHDTSLFSYLLYNFHKPGICVIFYVRNDGYGSDHNLFAKRYWEACSGGSRRKELYMVEQQSLKRKKKEAKAPE